MESGGRKIGENKLIAKKKAARTWGRSCSECGQAVQQEQATLCHMCSYTKGVCSICGVKILDTTSYSMSGSTVSATGKRKGSDDDPAKGDDRNKKQRQGSASWVLQKKTGYYYDKKSKYFFDPKSKMYFHHSTGKWTKGRSQYNSL